jgi:mannose-6-phosphate isomerase-like protein (cupin superfamily)
VPPHSSLAPALTAGPVGMPDGSFAMVEWSDPGGVTSAQRPIAGLHVHHEDDEAWYVLEGTLGFRLDDRELIAAAGAAVFVPHGTPHSYWNSGAGPARYLLVMPPRLLHLVAALHTGAAVDHAAVFRAHASELLA